MVEIYQAVAQFLEIFQRTNLPGWIYLYLCFSDLLYDQSEFVVQQLNALPISLSIGLFYFICLLFFFCGSNGTYSIYFPRIFRLVQIGRQNIHIASAVYLFTTLNVASHYIKCPAKKETQRGTLLLEKIKLLKDNNGFINHEVI